MPSDGQVHFDDACWCAIRRGRYHDEQPRHDNNQAAAARLDMRRSAAIP